MCSHLLKKSMCLFACCFAVSSITIYSGKSFAAITTAVQASVSQGNSSVTVKLGPKYGSEQWIAHDEFALNVPTSKTSDTSTPATLDGLANSATLSWERNFSGLWGKDKNGSPLDPADAYYGDFGFKLQAGPQAYTFYDSTTLAKSSGHNPTSAISIHTGRTWPDWNNIMTQLKYSYQNTYKDNSNKILCPSGGATPVTCVNGPIGAPDNVRQRVITLESRIQNQSGISTTVAISHDTQSKVSGIDIPIYLWGNNDSAKPQAFSAGVDLGWTNDPKSAHQGMISIFIGKPFSFYGY